MNRNTIGIVALIIIGLACGSAYANWEVVKTSAEVVRADGVKAAGELGPARAAAVGHVNSDGVIDLVAGHAYGEVGAIAVYFGNETFREGIKREMDRAARGEAPADPFLPEAVLFDLPFAPDWVAVGDFDADGARDVACAARGRSDLVWLAGDGRGGLGAVKSIALPGSATAMISGEVNRRDGMTDVVVAVETAAGAGLVVFEHPVGAFTAEPEWHPVAAPVTDVALGRLDGDAWIDIAAAADGLVVVFGRDRKLGLTRRQQAEVRPAEIKSNEVESLVNDLVVGRFSNLQHNEQLAVRRTDGVIELVSVADRSFVREEIGRFDPPEGSHAPLTASMIGYGPNPSLIARRAIGAELEVFDLPAVKSGAVRLVSKGAVGADAHLVVPVRLNRDARDDLVIFGDGEAPSVVKTFNQVTYVVNSVADPGTGGCDGAECTLREAILAANAGGAAADIVMNLPFAGATINVASELPWISQAGVAIDGTAGAHPFYYPVTLDGAACNFCYGVTFHGDETTGGQGTLTATALVNWESIAIFLDAESNLVEGCYVGLAGDLSTDGNNGIGIMVLRDHNTIGGTTTQARNIISGSGEEGVKVSLHPAALESYVYGTEIKGNLIGTTATGNSPFGNTVGISLQETSETVIGDVMGISAGGNVIASNTDAGVVTDRNPATLFGNSDLLVHGNLFGVGLDGETAVGVQSIGLFLKNIANVTVGGSTPGMRNIVGGNTTGIELGEGVSLSAVQGNYIGLGADGETPVANQRGILVGSPVVIGGVDAGLGNTICSNPDYGIKVSDTEGVDLLGNTVGTNADNDPGLGNGGGSPAGSNIYIFRCTSCGMGEIGNPDAGNLVVDAYIGLSINESSGCEVVGNRFGWPGADPFAGGIGIDGSDVQMTAIEDNEIYSASTGISFDESWGPVEEVRFSANVVAECSNLAIDLYPTGVTPNDPGDADSGPNGLQNFPVLLSAYADTGEVTGTLETNAEIATYEIEFYENTTCGPLGHGLAESYLGSSTLVTNSSGVGGFVATIPGLTTGRFISALAIDPDNNTSELSACIEVETVAPQEITIEFMGGSLSISEGEPAAEIDIVMTTSDGGVSEVASSVDYETYDDGAVAGQDYVSTSGTKLFPVGTASGAVQTVEVDLIDDILVEFNEDFVLEITNPTGAVIAGNNEFPVTILDNDSEPPIFADGFESGDTQNWDAVSP
ncbi:MAG: Calx-beta domain-containing protein [Thermoanaerobaculales bacterium]|nr:Calx-beta domain-containing protein [Thermoanaerobaculales bacterium]